MARDLLLALLLHLLADLRSLKDRELDALALRELVQRGTALADDEDVLLPRHELLTRRVNRVDDVERARVLVDVRVRPYAPTVLALDDRHHATDSKLHNLCNLAGLNVQLDRVAHTKRRARVADGAAIMGHNVRHALLRLRLLLNRAHLELGVSRVRDLLELEAPLDVVYHAVTVRGLLVEALLRLPERHDVHETCRVLGVGADAPVDLAHALHEDLDDLAAGEGELQAVAQDADQRQALACLVRARGRLRCPLAPHFVKHPVLRRVEALQVLLRSASHGGEFRKGEESGDCGGVVVMERDGREEVSKVRRGDEGNGDHVGGHEEKRTSELGGGDSAARAS